MATIKVCDKDTFRNDLAITLVDEADPGYCGGLHYADPVKGEIYYKEQNATWNPWPDDAFVIPIYQLFEKRRYSDQVDWNLADDLPWDEMLQAYLEEFDSNPLQKSDLIYFARNCSAEWEKLISFEEEISREEAISFAKSEILDKIEIETLEDLE